MVLWMAGAGDYGVGLMLQGFAVLLGCTTAAVCCSDALQLPARTGLSCKRLLCCSMHVLLSAVLVGRVGPCYEVVLLVQWVLSDAAVLAAALGCVRCDV
jgi:hypothetical protein